MKILYFILLLFIFGGCTPEADFTVDKTTTSGLIPVNFSLGNENEEVYSKSNFQTNNSILLANDNDSISISIKQEEWSNKKSSQIQERTAWTNSSNKVTWIKDDSIIIFMRDASGSDLSKRDNVLYKITTGGVSASPLVVDTSNPPLFFPNKTSNIKFYAFYPRLVANNGLVINYALPPEQSGINLARADIMYASTDSYTGANPNVSLNFKHKMSLLTFNIKGSLLSGLTTATLTRVTVSGDAITNTGTLDLRTGTLTPSTNKFTATVNTSQPVSLTSTATVNIIINPCTIINNSSSGNQLRVALTFSGLLNARTTSLVTNATFREGTRYIYNISLTL